MERITCPGCGIEHWPAQAWLHMECLNNVPVLAQSAPVLDAAVINETPKKTKDGRDRAHYNEYMRNKMREYRAKKKNAA